MTDLEMTKLCAEAMGYETIFAAGVPNVMIITANKPPEWAMTSGVTGRTAIDYNPLHDDAEAMALVKKFELSIDRHDGVKWSVGYSATKLIDQWLRIENTDLNRAIVECVAQMQAARTPVASPSVESTP